MATTTTHRAALPATVTDVGDVNPDQSAGPAAADGVPCALCGGETWAPHLAGLVDHLTGERFDVRRCCGCGVLATRPPPPPDQVGRYYPPRYRGNRHAFTGRLRDALRGRAVAACFPKGFRGRLLDVGCGTGSFARHMRSLGWDVAATEIDGPTVDRLRADGVDARLASEVEAGRDGADGAATGGGAAGAGGFGRPFDAVTAWHVLEHVDDPAGLARWVAGQLAPGGVFQATVPNAACAQARLFGRRWMHLDVPRHRHHFTPATLAAMLGGAGLRVDRRANVAWEYDWFGVIQSALDAACRRPNVLFDRLTAAPQAGRRATPDVAISYFLLGPLAAASLPPLAVGWAVGDGATLTLTCRRAGADAGADGAGVVP